MPAPVSVTALIFLTSTGIVVALSAARTAAAMSEAEGPEPPVIVPVYSVPVGP